MKLVEMKFWDTIGTPFEDRGSHPLINGMDVYI